MSFNSSAEARIYLASVFFGQTTQPTLKTATNGLSIRLATASKGRKHAGSTSAGSDSNLRLCSQAVCWLHLRYGDRFFPHINGTDRKEKSSSEDEGRRR
jgi:hypothetical protein